LSEKGQEILRQYHFQSASWEATSSLSSNRLFTEDALGGWSQAYDELIKKIWMTEIQPSLELESAATLIWRGE
jgi:hypothetical protein